MVAVCLSSALVGGIWMGGFVWLDREGVIIHDVLDNVFLCPVFVVV